MILVTGGAGYIGSHYALHERARDADVLIVDNLSRGHREAALDTPLLVGDLTDRAFLSRVFRAHRIDAVVHFAALAYVGESVVDPGPYYANNIGGTLALLDAMRDSGVSTLVFSSSCATYGHPQYSPIDERHPQRPINPYGESKLCCETMLAAYARAYGLRYVSLRYFNAAGADAEARLGESHAPETHLVPLALEVAAGRRREIVVFGTDYPTPDGTCIRDYIHVVDLVSAHALALDRLRDGAPSACFNLGTEHGHSVREVVHACARVTGRDIRAVDGPRRDGDPDRLVASAGAARAELGWRPRYGELDDIIATAWRWQQAPRY